MKEICVESFYKRNYCSQKVIPQLFASKKKKVFWAGDVAHWQSSCLECSKPWVQSPALEKCQNFHFVLYTREIIGGIQLVALSQNQRLRRLIPSGLPETLGRSRMSPASAPHRRDWLHTVLRACQNLGFVYSWQVLGGCTDDYAQILDKCSTWAAKYQTDQLEKRRQHGYVVPGESPRKGPPSTIGLRPQLSCPEDKLGRICPAS